MDERDLLEPGSELDELAHRVIGAAIEVHRLLGPGYVEGVYEEALAVEFRLRGISFVRQLCVEVQYKGENVGAGKLDFLVEGKLVLELKAVAALGPVHSAQVLSYLKATGVQLGLVINFNVPILKQGIRRIILSH